MNISPDEIARVARLARLRLDATEAVALSAQLSEVLGHLDALRSLGDPAGTAHDATRPAAPLRDDHGVPDLLRSPPEQWAPAWSEPFFTVPRLATHATGVPPNTPDPASGTGRGPGEGER